MRIDAHQHYWKLSRNDYGWLTPELTVLYRDFLPGDLTEQLHQHGINKTIVVQAAPTLEETEFLLSLCEQDETLAGVVGWLDFEADTFRESFAALRKNPYFIGVRIMLQDIDASEFLLRPNVIDHLKFLTRHDFPVDLLIRASQLPVIVKLLEQIPDLKAVIDHIGKPQIAKQEKEPWQQLISEVAAYPNVFCKLSGMVTEADLFNWKESDFSFYIHHALKFFGKKRVMFGSDWPVCLLGANYSQVIDILLHNLPDTLTSDDMDDIFGQNASRFYNLKTSHHT
ncbi:amidohydrolase family protein [Paenibacillus sp. Soil787]|uniref:amidohydrolase family protein n=1 Tax=Paenibacillus sp. Soil787 TaxID=1736411 RepID=UPI0006FEE3EF|nr:amidohydrolase family protein [Paenibacillus sp. Soil787]KRF42963.1 amidohydrolase [Paenibacillus sp. Soil787]